MTVAELVAALSLLPQDAEVIVQKNGSIQDVVYEEERRNYGGYGGRLFREVRIIGEYEF
jgi:hypothetical protein